MFQCSDAFCVPLFLDTLPAFVERIGDIVLRLWSVTLRWFVVFGSERRNRVYIKLVVKGLDAGDGRSPKSRSLLLGFLRAWWSFVSRGWGFSRRRRNSHSRSLIDSHRTRMTWRTASWAMNSCE